MIELLGGLGDFLVTNHSCTSGRRTQPIMTQPIRGSDLDDWEDWTADISLAWRRRLGLSNDRNVALGPCIDTDLSTLAHRDGD